MRKIFYYLWIVIIATISCDNNEIQSEQQVQNQTAETFTVQGIPYSLSRKNSKDFFKNIDTRTNATNGGDVNFSMSDIKYWVGKGNKKAALVIEWHDGKQPDALVWGYKWSGDAYGIDMIRAIVKVDKRLIFLSHMTGPMGYTIAGLGYNINHTGDHYLIYDGNQNNPQYPQNGIVMTDAYNYDDWTYSDTTDHWQSGWYNGYWSYWVKDDVDDSWEYSQWGASSRKLEDGSWDGWSFLDDMSEWGGRQLGSKFIPAVEE